MDKAAIETVRAFNRTVAEEIGLLGDRFLGRRRPPGESRMLWEIGPGGADVRSLRRRLRLDSGYVTRVMQSLAREGLVRVRVSPADGRVRRATLTRKGLRERGVLDRRSDGVAERTLTSLTDKQREELMSAMTQVVRLLRVSMVVFDAESPHSPDAKVCLQRYFAELGRRFEGGFDPALSNPAEASDLIPPAGLFIVARLHGEPVGCGALKFHRKAYAEVKRMWLAESVRGLGLGARLLAELEQRARLAGVRKLRLETNRTLTQAIALYRRSGYVEVERFNDEPYAHHWFEKTLRPTTSG